MSNRYRSLDRTTNATVFFASLLIAVGLLASVTAAFGPTAPQVQVVDAIQEVVVQG